MLPSVILLLFINCLLVTFSTASITTRDIQIRCCNNHWVACCKHFSMDMSTDQEGSAFSDTEGSAESDVDYSGTLKTLNYCQRYTSGHHDQHTDQKCLNNHLLFRDMRSTRNLIEELHRCSATQDYEFINATLKLGQRMRPSGLRCCRKDQQRSSNLGIFYLKMLLFNNLDELQKEYHLQQAIPRVPCNQYGDTKVIEFRLSEHLQRMGVYLACAKEIAC